MARVSVDSGDPHEGIRVAGYGLLATEYEDTPPAVRAGLYLEEAWARAHLADEHGALDALSRAADDVARTDPAAVPPWASTALQLLKGGGHAGLRGQVYVELARTHGLRRHAETGVGEAGTALAAYDGQRRAVTGHVLDRLSLATGLLRAGARDEGVAAANDILDKATALQSTRARTVLGDVADAARTYAGNRDADDLRAHIAAVTAA